MPRGIYSSPPRLDLVSASDMFRSTSQYEGPHSERPYEAGDNQYVCVICGHSRGSHMASGEHCLRRTADGRALPGIDGSTSVPFKRHWKVIPKALP